MVRSRLGASRCERVTASRSWPSTLASRGARGPAPRCTGSGIASGWRTGRIPGSKRRSRLSTRLVGTAGRRRSGSSSCRQSWEPDPTWSIALERLSRARSEALGSVAQIDLQFHPLHKPKASTVASDSASSAESSTATVTAAWRPTKVVSAPPLLCRSDPRRAGWTLNRPAGLRPQSPPRVAKPETRPHPRPTTAGQRPLRGRDSSASRLRAPVPARERSRRPIPA